MASTDSAPRLGWIGLGNMGRGMVKNLFEKGNLTHPLQIYNRTTSKAETLSSQLNESSRTNDKVQTKTEVCTSIEEVVQKSDIVFICLGDDEAVQKTIDTIINTTSSSNDTNAEPQKLIVDCSTIHPDTTTKISEQLTRDNKFDFIASPVFGAPAMADSGNLVFVLAGPSSSLSKIQPYTTNVMGRTTIPFADAPPSKATTLKIIGNTFILNMVLALSEGHTLAEKSGVIDVHDLHSFIEAIFPGPYVAYSNRLISGDYWNREEPLFAVDLARKDARHARGIAKGVGVEMKGLEIADGYLAGVKAHVGEKGDIAGVYGAKRVEAGLKFEN